MDTSPRAQEMFSKLPWHKQLKAAVYFSGLLAIFFGVELAEKLCGKRNR